MSCKSLLCLLLPRLVLVHTMIICHSCFLLPAGGSAFYGTACGAWGPKRLHMWAACCSLSGPPYCCTVSAHLRVSSRIVTHVPLCLCCFQAYAHGQLSQAPGAAPSEAGTDARPLSTQVARLSAAQPSTVTSVGRRAVKPSLPPSPTPLRHRTASVEVITLDIDAEAEPTPQGAGGEAAGGPSTAQHAATGGQGGAVQRTAARRIAPTPVQATPLPVPSPAAALMPTPSMRSVAPPAQLAVVPNAPAPAPAPPPLSIPAPCAVPALTASSNAAQLSEQSGPSACPSAGTATATQACSAPPRARLSIAQMAAQAGAAAAAARVGPSERTGDDSKRQRVA